MNSRHWRTAPVFTSLITASLIAGWSIPAFYDWTDSAQTRPSPLLWKVPLSAALVSLAFCLALPWLPNLNDEPTEKSDPRMRFGIRSLLLATSAVAGTLTLLTKFPVTASVLVFTGTAVHFSVFIWRHPPNRFAASALIACMFLPFAWVIGYDELERILPSLAWMFAGMPAIVPAP